MNAPTEELTGPQPAAPQPEPRQRWRLTFARSAPSSGESPTGRDYVGLWETTLAESRLPVALNDAGRPRFAIGAPLPARTDGRAELADLWLTARAPAWRVREALGSVMPADHALVGIEDVWLGAPALAGRVAGADYRVVLPDGLDRASVDAACGRLLGADRLPRERAKAGGVRAYDLRPLLVAITVTEVGVDGRGPDDAPIEVAMRLRIHPELGSGRPSEVVAALSDELGEALEPLATTRERLLLVEDLDPVRAG